MLFNCRLVKIKKPFQKVQFFGFQHIISGFNSPKAAEKQSQKTYKHQHKTCVI